MSIHSQTGLFTLPSFNYYLVFYLYLLQFILILWTRSRVVIVLCVISKRAILKREHMMADGTGTGRLFDIYTHHANSIHQSVFLGELHYPMCAGWTDTALHDPSARRRACEPSHSVVSGIGRFVRPLFSRFSYV